MPDYAVMEGLCEILKINVNELLSGERLPSQEYTKKAEENMMNLIEYYDELYPSDETQRKFFIDLLSNYQAPSKFLRVGCGTGNLESFLAKRIFLINRPYKKSKTVEPITQSQ
mgnify:CR=1 FL=1